LLFAVSPAGADDGGDIIDRYVSLAVQGDLSRAETLFSKANGEKLPASADGLSRQFQARFIKRDDSDLTHTGDELADRVVTAYHAYWVSVLMREVTLAKGLETLEASLQVILHDTGVTTETRGIAQIAVVLAEQLRERGFHALETDAPPLRDLFLWKQEEIRKFSVRLTDGTENVDVVFMSDLFSQGWKEFATLGLVSTTGWVEDGRLYCVDWAYDRQTENFRVSYLKHETRHLADFRLFPGLSSADLEYRAKLTELTFASTTTTRLLNDFSQKSAPNPESPHAYANYRVIRDIYREIMGAPLPAPDYTWALISTDKINRAARVLLKADSGRLQALSP